MDNPTLRDLYLMTHGDIGMQITLGIITAASAEDILAKVDPAIEHILQEFSRTPKERHNRDEDGLSIDLITSLKHLGFQASHDTTTGGHCDIVIQGKFDFLWLGEAKIHSNYDWLLKGFNQLDSRYATAIPNQDRGGLVIYHKGNRADQIMDKWAAHLAEERPEIVFEPRELGSLSINTRHIHERTGREYHVRHFIVSLYWNPKD